MILFLIVSLVTTAGMATVLVNDGDRNKMPRWFSVPLAMMLSPMFGVCFGVIAIVVAKWLA